MFKHATILILLLLSLSGCRMGAEDSNLSACLKDAKDSDQIGACRFLFDDWETFNAQGLRDSVVPIKAVRVALVLSQSEPQTEEDKIELRAEAEHELHSFFERQGLFYPSEISNLKDKGMENILAKADGGQHAMGVAAGRVKTGLGGAMGGAVFSCASCHAGRLYDENGKPTDKAWLGIGNSSYNVATLVDEVYGLLIRMVDHWPKFMRMYKAIYNEKGLDAEILGLKLSHKLLADKMNHLRATTGHFRPFTSGAPGLTNGIAAVEFALGEYKNPDTFNPTDNALISTPALYKRYFRTSFLIDGIYSTQGEPKFREITASEVADPAVRDARTWEVARIASIFTIGTVGTHADRAAHLNSEVYEALRFIQTRTPPKFPGHVDAPQATRGRAIYQNACASCHGDYSGELANLQLSRFPNRRIKLAEIGTDTYRVDRIDGASLSKLSSLDVAKGISVEKSDGYVPPILDGLWITAPYLHNGSVPTLWDLMHPTDRPKMFKIGDHALDYSKMGVAYPAGYQPFTTPFEYDTSKTGQGNQGHEKPFDTMSEPDKADLLEFLKLL